MTVEVARVTKGVQGLRRDSVTRRIVTQKAMWDARRSVRFCYLCGRSLPPLDEKQRRSKVVGEHVIPKSFLREPPDRADERWPVELEVHKECEQEKKRERDHFASLMHSIHLKPVEEWASVGHFRRLALKPKIGIDPDHPVAVPLLEGIAPVLDGVWQWIRGLCVAVYQEPLGATELWSRVLLPVPAFGDGEGGVPLDMHENAARLTMQVMRMAIARDRWDGISAWGGAIDFRCVWWKRATDGLKPPWVCFYALVVPGVLDWSHKVLVREMVRPWCGTFALQQCPNESSVLEAGDFPVKQDSAPAGAR